MKKLFLVFLSAVILAGCAAQNTSDKDDEIEALKEAAEKNAEAIDRLTQMLEEERSRNAAADIVASSETSVPDITPKDDPASDIPATADIVVTEDTSTEDKHIDIPEGSTRSQQNALNKAISRIAKENTSRAKLIKNLVEWDSFPQEDAIFAADNCGADWKLFAANKARERIKSGDISRDKLVQYLVTWDGFTEDEAEYAAQEVYDKP